MNMIGIIALLNDITKSYHRDILMFEILFINYKLYNGKRIYWEYAENISYGANKGKY